MIAFVLTDDFNIHKVYLITVMSSYCISCVYIYQIKYKAKGRTKELLVTQQKNCKNKVIFLHGHLQVWAVILALRATFEVDVTSVWYAMTMISALHVMRLVQLLPVTPQTILCSAYWHVQILVRSANSCVYKHWKSKVLNINKEGNT